MESVLQVYQQQCHPDFPVICLDEATKQLVKETVEPVAAQPRQPKRQDYKYERNGTANLFMLCDPMLLMATYRGHRTSNSSGLCVCA